MIKVIRKDGNPIAVSGKEVDGSPFEFELKYLAGRTITLGGTRISIDGVGHVIVTAEEAEAIYRAKREMQGVAG